MRTLVLGDPVVHLGDEPFIRDGGLVVEDEKKLAGFIKRALLEDAHAVGVAHDGEAGAYLPQKEDYDLLVLDILLPKKDGLSVLSELRAAKRAMPVLLEDPGRGAGAARRESCLIQRETASIHTTVSSGTSSVASNAIAMSSVAFSSNPTVE
jgi:CheY-like chemotaxis protein